MSSTSGSRRGWSRRSRYQSINERSVTRNSRISFVTCASSSRGAARRSASSRTNSAAGSKERAWGGGAAAGSRSRRRCSARSVLIGALLEHDLKRPVLEMSASRRVAGQRRRQDDRPLLAAHAHHNLEPDLLQLQLVALGEGERQAQRGAPVLGGQLLGDVLVQHGGRIGAVEYLPGQPVEHLRAHHLALEERRAEDRHGLEGGAHELHLLPLNLARGARRRRRRRRRGTARRTACGPAERAGAARAGSARATRSPRRETTAAA